MERSIIREEVRQLAARIADLTPDWRLDLLRQAAREAGYYLEPLKTKQQVDRERDALADLLGDGI